MSLALIVSTSSLIPRALWHSWVISPLSSTSDAGTKSAQRSQCMVLTCAYAGARPLARMPAMPATFVAAALAVVMFRNLRRGILVMGSSHSVVTDVTHDRLAGVGSRWLIAE